MIEVLSSNKTLIALLNVAAFILLLRQSYFGIKWLRTRGVKSYADYMFKIKYKLAMDSYKMALDLHIYITYILQKIVYSAILFLIITIIINGINYEQVESRRIVAVFTAFISMLALMYTLYSAIHIGGIVKRYRYRWYHRHLLPWTVMVAKSSKGRER